ncbi:class I SAM-dependent DNA methyltransferase [Helicobacter sp. MIT 05-5293]|uniref:HsdM family class I SAM-dependent methyltransferase n=1 Tax=Helicobacter sp. MIT 05-5293 TaxID=1548149 RepID=UPI00051DBA7B|nr:class I SAM-dependent DNA methyltransferase [Helicobacter sp. MIT 05-5293]
MNATLQDKILKLIDKLKATCANDGMGNDSGEYKIISQIFLYKFLNDRFVYAFKQSHKAFKELDSQSFYEKLMQLGDEEYQEALEDIGAVVCFGKEDLLPTLFSKQNQSGFSTILDDCFTRIANREENRDIFSILTEGGAKISLFEPIMHNIIDPSKRDNFARAIISPLADFNFTQSFNQGYDFFAPIFEYLIKDYNKDNGGKYAEYYTPYSIARIMARILTQDKPYKSVTCYDPSAGSGTLLMSLAHTIGQNKCSIYAQDISQKSSQLLRLNLILNDLNHSIHNITQGNTLTHPAHKDKKFDFIVSNPPFKLDFSEYRDELVAQKQRFFAGVPNIPKKDKDKMDIYLCFFQHLLYSLSPTGKAAIVLPTGFITATKIEMRIRKFLVESKILRGCIIMPKDIFATTGTNVSVIFIDKESSSDKALLIDASSLGEKTKIGGKERTLLRDDEIEQIISTFNKQEVKEDFSILVSFEDIEKKNYSFSAGQYFDFKIAYSDMDINSFEAYINETKENLESLFSQSQHLQKAILENFATLHFKGKA